MKRSELEHVIRAAGAITGSKNICVIGSQAILGFLTDPPAELVVSQEADIWPSDDPGKTDLIDGTIGELSPFHETFGYFAHGVGPETALLPANWKSRAVTICNPNTNGYTGICIHPLDIAISKLHAGRPKDHVYVRGMIDKKLVSALEIRQITEAEVPDAARRRVTDNLEIALR